MTEYLQLLDYRRRVSEIYAGVRQSNDPVTAWETWKLERNLLFATHPQTPIEDTSRFDGVSYFDYDPEFRTLGAFTPDPAEDLDLDNSAPGITSYSKIGTVVFFLLGQPMSLDLFWLNDYAGGLFLPFRDLTGGQTTYGGGRYLLDSAKGADLGHTDDEVVLDFNYAFHPSCVHSNRWSCPLAPASNLLAIEVTAGERLSDVEHGAEYQDR